MGVVLPHLPGEMLRAVLVSFSQCFPRFQSALVNFSRFFPLSRSILVNFSELQSVLVNFSQLQSVLVTFSQLQSVLVSFSQLRSVLVNFSQLQSALVNFSQLQSVLVSVNQVTQDKNAELFTDRKVGQNNTQQKGGFPKGWFWRMFPQNENRSEGTFGCSPGTKTGTRVRSHVPPKRKPERGYIQHNHPFTTPPFCLPMNLWA